MRTTEQQGTYLNVSYIALRKRKARNLGYGGATFEEAFEEAKKLIPAQGGKIVGGFTSSCSRYPVDMPDGRIIWMQSVQIFAPRQALTEEQIKELNGK